MTAAPSRAGCRPPCAQPVRRPARSSRRLPVRREILGSLQHGGVRPQTPAYQNVSIAISTTLSPPSSASSPGSDVDELGSQIAGRPRVQGADPMTMQSSAPRRRPGAAGTARHRRADALSEGARAERGSAGCCARPRSIVMLAVTAYPIGYASGCRCSATTCASRPRGVRRAEQLRHRAHLEFWWDAFWGHRVHHGRLGRRRAGPRHGAGPGHAPGAWSAGERCAPRS